MPWLACSARSTATYEAFILFYVILALFAVFPLAWIFAAPVVFVFGDFPAPRNPYGPSYPTGPTSTLPLPPAEVADQLGIGTRHLRRWQNSAQEALADRLCDGALAPLVTQGFTGGAF